MRPDPGPGNDDPRHRTVGVVPGALDNGRPTGFAQAMRRPAWKWLLAVVALPVVLVVVLRSLPPPRVDPASIDAAVHREKPLLDAARALPVFRTYPEPAQFQPNPSFCGPTSLANVLASFGSPTTPSGVLSGTGVCLTGLCFGGLTLDQLADLARHNGRRVTVHRDLDPDGLRAALRRSNDPARRFIVNFTREPIFHSGGGHFSPIGGYLEERDLVVVLDVNERYGPWLVERAKLFAAVDTVDGSSGRKRGLLEIE